MTQEFASNLSQIIRPGTVVLLDGPLGSGKTTFTQGFGKALGIKRAIKSPTYTIVKEYAIPNKTSKLVHMDAYRLEDGGVDSIDLDYYLTEDSIILIEWSDFVRDHLPEDFVKITFTPTNDLNERIIELTLSPKAKDRYGSLLRGLGQSMDKGR